MRFFSLLAVVFFVAGLFLLASCGENNFGAGTAGGGLAAFSYELRDEDEGCTTGRHSFENLNDMCRGLRSDSLNDGCAPLERERHFLDNKCPGRFTRIP